MCVTRPHMASGLLPWILHVRTSPPCLCIDYGRSNLPNPILMYIHHTKYANHTSQKHLIFLNTDPLARFASP